MYHEILLTISYSDYGYFTINNLNPEFKQIVNLLTRYRKFYINDNKTCYSITEIDKSDMLLYIGITFEPYFLIPREPVTFKFQ